MPSRKPPLFVQVDVDGLWAVRACYGRPERDSFQRDPVWDEGVPRLAAMFRRLGLPAGFFIVGRDLEVPTKRDRAASLWRQGFEAGNHSYSHRLGLTEAPVGTILSEIRRTDAALRDTGADPWGFRSPGYDIDARLLHCVWRCGYRYDASVLPTRMGFAFRLATAWLARSAAPLRTRQFGRVAYALAPRAPYIPDPHRIRKRAKGDAPPRTRILEIPVGVTPLWRMPMTATTLLRMGTLQRRDIFRHLAQTRRPLLLLLHGIDGTDCRRPIVFDTRRPSLGGFDLSGERKERKLREVLEDALDFFKPTLAKDYAQEAYAL